MIGKLSKVLIPFQSLWNFIKLHRKSEIKWQSPQRAKIAVFDVAGLELLLPLFGGQRHEVVYMRGERLYITPQIVWRTIINLARVHHPFVAYALSLVEVIRPTIVVTYVDNNEYFGEIARHCAGIRFLAIQNGMRSLWRDNQAGARQIFLPEFACFGEYEVDLYTNHGAKVGKFYPIGSLRDAYYREHFAEKVTSIKYDLCLISEAEEGLKEFYPEIEAAIKKLANYLFSYCERTGKKVYIAARNHPEENPQGYAHEISWYQDLMGDHGVLIPNNRKEYSTYQLVDASAVSLSFYSTALVEALARGKKSLFCNFTGNHRYDLPEAGVWTLGNCSYEAFEERLSALLTMSDEMFQEQSSAAASYLIKYSPEKPAPVVLENLISEATGD